MSVHDDGRKLEWDLTFDYGKSGERETDDLLRSLFDGTRTIEVKTDDKWFESGNLYVEYQSLNRNGWENSGIATSEADVWAFRFSDTGVTLFVPGAQLKRLVKILWRTPANRRECVRSGNPTKGVIVRLSDLHALVGEMPYPKSA